MHRRRKLLLATAALFAALVMGTEVRAERPRIVGWLCVGSPKSDSKLLEAFLGGLRAHGWVQGKNLRFEPRFALGKSERLPALAAELIKLKPDVIFSCSTPTHVVFKKLTSTIPIVMGTGADPVAVGLVPSLSHPGGNITGMVAFLHDTSIKMVEILADLIPQGSRVVLLIEATTPFFRSQQVVRAAKTLGVQVTFMEVATKEDVMRTFAAMAKDPPAGIVQLPGPMLWWTRRESIAETAKLKVPSVYPFEVFSDVGGLISYSSPIDESYARAANYVDRILRGAKPGDLPIEQPTRFRLVVNLKTAKAQGITIPQSILLRADRVIE
jgi:putative ABC transport system substrate-binding protein